MSTDHCKHCFGTDLRDSRPMWWDALGLAWFARPVRCRHCFARQYVPANSLVRRVADSFRSVDDKLNRLDPQILIRALSQEDELTDARSDS